jgi:hypothetical protein
MLPDMGRHPPNDPKLWRTRADEIRALADRMQDPLSQDVMLQTTTSGWRKRLKGEISRAFSLAAKRDSHSRPFALAARPA